MAYLSVDDFLLGIQGGETDVELDGIGVVRVRSLTTVEVQAMNTTARGDEMRLSLLAIQTALVQPPLTAGHITMLETAKPGAVAVLARRIMELSGLGAEFEKKVGIGS